MIHACTYRFRPLAFALAALCLGVGLLAPAGAWAHFTRPFVRQLTGVPDGVDGAEVPFETESIGAISLDGEGNLLIAKRGGKTLDEFGSSGAYKGTLQVPLSSGEAIGTGVAFNTLSSGPFSGDIYVSSSPGRYAWKTEILNKNGVLQKSFALPEKGFSVGKRVLAVDNSNNPLDSSAGDVYALGAYQSASLQKYNAAGEPAAWEGFNAKGFEGCGCSVSGNEIVFNVLAETSALAVDPVSGNLWVAIGKSVFEFTPRGEIIREITGEEAPLLGEIKAFNTSIDSLAVDPTNGDVLVSIANTVTTPTGSFGEGAVDEFDSEGVYLGQVTQAAGLTLRGAYGLAVGASGQAYVVNRPFDSYVIDNDTHAVDVFGSGHFDPGLHPAVTSDAKSTSVTLNGLVDPNPISTLKKPVLAAAVLNM